MGGEELKRYRRKAGYSQQALADEIGVTRNAVQNWERGRRNPELDHCRSMANLLGLPVLMVLSWWHGDTLSESTNDDVASSSLLYTPDILQTLKVIENMGQFDRRAVLKGLAFFGVAAAVGPSRDWLLATLEEAVAPRSEVSSRQVDAIRAAFAEFQQIDVVSGGGPSARQQLVDYFTTVVTPLLRRNKAHTENGRALYTAAAEQLYLIGWMAFDCGDHGIAQRYLIQALRLAQEARCPELGGHVLAGLADQATLLGHPDQALQYARAGRAGLARGHSPACLADLWVLQARASAVMGDAAAAVRAVLESERNAGQIDLGQEPEWARFIPGAYLSGEYANTFDDLGQSKDADYYAVLSADQAAADGRARRGSLAYTTIARTALAQHDLEAAADAAIRASELGASVSSIRSTTALQDLRRKMRKHKSSPFVAAYLESTADLVALS